MKYCPEIVSELCRYIEEGVGRMDSCELAGINFDTFREWWKDPRKTEFPEAIKKAEARWKGKAIMRIQKAGVKTWQANAWLLERKFPEEFALRIKNSHSLPGGGPVLLAAIDVSRFSNRTLLKIAFGKIAKKKALDVPAS